jgi:hypothetical protein
MSDQPVGSSAPQSSAPGAAKLSNSDDLDQSKAGDAVASNEKPKTGTLEELKTIGGLIAILAGLLVVLVIVVVAILKLKSPNAAITGGITAAGSMVGAYFGVKIGSDNTKEAVEGQEKALQQVAKATEDHAAASEKNAATRLQEQKDHASALTALALELDPAAKDKALATITDFKNTLAGTIPSP